MENETVFDELKRLRIIWSSKPGMKPPELSIDEVARLASEAGMSYGQYVAAMKDGRV
jgi:hypothetical protein